MTTYSDPKVGTIWLEVKTNRRIKILEEEVHGTGPAWTYIDPCGKDEAHSADYPTWFWHYCFAEDFFMWKRFTFLEAP